MASVSTGDKSQADLNLVPFIDLLSTLTLFLLVTAVWMQVSAIPASIDSKGKGATAEAEQKRVDIVVTAGAYRITWPAGLAGPKFPPMVPRAAKVDNGGRLQAVMKAAYAALGSSKKAPPVAAVSATDDVSYGAVIEAVDSLKSAGLPMVALKTD